VSTTESQTAKRGVRKERKGIVVSRSGAKTVVVEVERRTRHPLYGKVVRRLRKLHAHDEKDEVNVGDTVRIVETRPISKLKRWRVIEVVAKGEQGTPSP
jgi:small subunit ribosomal protein S17